MSLNLQFNHASSGAQPFCSLRTAVWALGVTNGALGVAVLMAAHSLKEWATLMAFHALWLEPTVLLSLLVLCFVAKRQALSLSHTLLIAGGLAFVSVVVVALMPAFASVALLFLALKAVAFTLPLAALLWLWHAPAPTPQPVLEEAQLSQLGAAIRPHFFFNALNAVMGLIRVNPKQAEAVLQDTAELFRSVMQQHEQRLVTLGTEIDTCQQYARIEQARLAQRLVLDWHIDQALLAVSVPPFCLQPLIENAIRHGIEPLAKGGKVSISVQRVEQQLVMRVTNPVVSELERYSATKAAQHNGIALDNIAQRLALMYDQAAQFEHGVVEGRYESQITLPLEFAP